MLLRNLLRHVCRPCSLYGRFLLIAGMAALSTPHLQAQTPAAEQIKALKEAFTARLAKVSEAEQKAVEPLRADYLKQLERVRDQVRAQGSLDGVLDAEAALAAEQSGSEPPVAKSIGVLLNKVRSNYERTREATIAQYAPGRARVASEYSAALTVLEQRLTRSNDLDGAREVRSARMSPPPGVSVDVLKAMVGERTERDGFTIIKPEGFLQTEARFQPPLEIEYVFKTDTQFRLKYTGFLIFNWELNKNQLRIDGGPGSGKHKDNAGRIPQNQLVTIRQVVLPDKMTIFVDGKERASWDANYSNVNEPIRVQSAFKAVVSMKSVTVRKL
jgi:hypothetical protein